MISFKHKFIFIHIPKSAGTSIENALYPYSDDVVVGGLIKPGEIITRMAREKKVKLDNYRHFSYEKYREILGDNIDNFFIFSVLRNPYDRIPSLYYHSNITTVSLTKFICSIVNAYHIVPSIVVKMNMIKTFIGDVKDIFLLRFENLDKDWTILLKKLNLPHVNLEHLNKDRIQNYDNLYKDPRLSKVMEVVFKEEIEEYFLVDEIVEDNIVIEEPIFEKKKYEYFTINIIDDITDKIEKELHINWKF